MYSVENGGMYRKVGAHVDKVLQMKLLTDQPRVRSSLAFEYAGQEQRS